MIDPESRENLKHIFADFGQAKEAARFYQAVVDCKYFPWMGLFETKDATGRDNLIFYLQRQDTSSLKEQTALKAILPAYIPLQYNLQSLEITLSLGFRPFQNQTPDQLIAECIENARFTFGEESSHWQIAPIWKARIALADFDTRRNLF